MTGHILDTFQALRKGVGFIPMNFRVQIEQEEDGRWIAEVVDLPGILAYGKTCEEAQGNVQALFAS